MRQRWLVPLLAMSILSLGCDEVTDILEGKLADIEVRFERVDLSSGTRTAVTKPPTHRSIALTEVVDGKLYLNYDATVQKRWEKDIPGFIKKAEANWPKVLE